MYLLFLALVLGFKHAYDADHLIAVSNFLVRSHNMRNTLSMSLNWVLGHMATAGVISLILYVAFSEAIVSSLSYFEMGVGAMLVILGILGIAWETGRFHVHRHKHGGSFHTHHHVHPFGLRRHFHSHIFVVGVIQGLASNDELFTFLVVSLGVITLPWLFLNIGVFSLGVALGMVLFGYMVRYPIARIGAIKIKRVVGVSVGVLSILYGSLLLLGFV